MKDEAHLNDRKMKEKFFKKGCIECYAWYRCWGGKLLLKDKDDGEVCEYYREHKASLEKEGKK